MEQISPPSPPKFVGGLFCLVLRLESICHFSHPLRCLQPANNIDLRIFIICFLIWHVINNSHTSEKISEVKLSLSNPKLNNQINQCITPLIEMLIHLEKTSQRFHYLLLAHLDMAFQPKKTWLNWNRIKYHKTTSLQPMKNKSARSWLPFPQL